MPRSFVVSSMAIILLATGCRPPKDHEQPTLRNGGEIASLPNKRSDAELKEKRAKYSVSSEQFAAEFTKDREAAAKKYSGQIIEISGTVSDVGLHITSNAYLAFDVAEKPGFVQCFTVDQEPWHKVLPGAKVKIKGTCETRSRFERCEIVEANPIPIPEFIAAKLSGEFAANRMHAVKKYGGKYLIVTGHILDRQVSDVGTLTFTLKATEKMKVLCSFALPESKLVQSFKSGEQLRVVGTCSLYAGEGGEIRMQGCLPLKQP